MFGKQHINRPRVKRSASRAASGALANLSALIFAPRIWLPQMTSRDLVPMGRYYRGPCEPRQCH
jgi:hypothetical protein